MTPEMRAQRVGKLTASKAAVIMGGDNTKGLADYVKTLAFERLYGDTGEDGFQSAAMTRGSELEARAVEWYEFDQDCIVVPGGECIEHRLLPFVGASPDARREDRVVEAKCLLHKAWIDARIANEIPSEYRWQCRWQQWVLEVNLVDFVVWHPVAGGFVIQRSVTDAECKQMQERAIYVNVLVDEYVQQLRDLRAAA